MRIKRLYQLMLICLALCFIMLSGISFAAWVTDNQRLGNTITTGYAYVELSSDSSTTTARYFNVENLMPTSDAALTTSDAQNPLDLSEILSKATNANNDILVAHAKIGIKNVGNEPVTAHLGFSAIDGSYTLPDSYDSSINQNIRTAVFAYDEEGNASIATSRLTSVPLYNIPLVDLFTHQVSFSINTEDEGSGDIAFFHVLAWLPDSIVAEPQQGQTLDLPLGSITAENGKTCAFIINVTSDGEVKIEAPKDLKISGTNLTWGAVNGATGYEINYYKIVGENEVLERKVTSDTTSFLLNIDHQVEASYKLTVQTVIGEYQSDVAEFPYDVVTPTFDGTPKITESNGTLTLPAAQNFTDYEYTYSYINKDATTISVDNPASSAGTISTSAWHIGLYDFTITLKGNGITQTLTGPSHSQSEVLFKDGDGSQASPHLIYKLGEEAEAGGTGMVTAAKNTFYSQIKDIAFDDATKSFSTSRDNAFAGYYDGNGKQISGATRSTGIFGGVSETGVVTDIIITDFSAEFTASSGNIEAGAIAAYNFGSISFIDADIKLTATSSDYTVWASGIGGIVGTNKGSISNCIVRGSIQATNYANVVGGIAGRVDGSEATIEKCANYANISSQKSNIGGIVGFVEGNATVNNSRNFGTVYCGETHTDVSSAGGTGGIVGFVGQGNITNCINSNSVSAPSAFNIGGIVGRLQGLKNNGNANVVNCISESKTSNSQTINISGGSFIGGIAGYIGFDGFNSNTEYKGSVSKSVNNSQVEAAKGLAGGIAGFTAGDILSSVNYGNVSITSAGTVSFDMRYNNAANQPLCIDNNGSQWLSEYANFSAIGGIAGFVGCWPHNIDKGGYIGTSYNRGKLDDNGHGVPAGGIFGLMYGRNVDNSYSACEISSSAVSESNSDGGVGLIAGGLWSHERRLFYVRYSACFGLTGQSSRVAGNIESITSTNAEFYLTYKYTSSTDTYALARLNSGDGQEGTVITGLGYFQADIHNINGGYPVLAWQNTLWEQQNPPPQT